MSEQCEQCPREATTYVGMDTTPLCKGHAIMAYANIAWNEQRSIARRWFDENPSETTNE